MKAVLGLGSNLGDKERSLRAAVGALGLVPGVRVLRTSSVWVTEPWGYTDQPPFYNAVVEVESDLSPQALLGACLGIEAGIGRVRSFRNGPRVIDIDLLLYEDAVSDTPELRLPHPGIRERDFVLLPLGELYPDGEALGFSFADARREAAATSRAERTAIDLLTAEGE